MIDERIIASIGTIELARIYSKHNDSEVSISEPDDRIEQYIDFLERINPADWGNDSYLLELIDNVFCRKGVSE